jgi:hypothetical protein
MNALPKPMELTATVINQAAASEIVLHIGDDVRIVRIDRVMVSRSAGTAATYQPAIGNKTGFTTNTVNEKYLATSVAVAVLTDDTEIQGYSKTDALGNLYMRTNPNAGADNTFTYSVIVSAF